MSIVQAWIPDDAAVTIKLCIALPGIVLLFLLWSRGPVEHVEDDGDAMSLPLSGLSTVWPFFKARSDFISRGFQLTGRAIFKFNLLRVSAGMFWGVNLRLIVAVTEYRYRGLRRIRQTGFLFLQRTRHQ